MTKKIILLAALVLLCHLDFRPYSGTPVSLVGRLKRLALTGSQGYENLMFSRYDSRYLK